MIAAWLDGTDSDRRAALVRAAMSLIGIVEEPLGSNRSPIIDTMMDDVGSPRGQSWCAAFVCYCLAEARLPVPKPNGGACETIHQWGWENGLYRPCNQLADAAVGDIVLYNFDGGPVAHHVGIVCRIRPEGFWVTEGNTTTIPNDREGDGVYYKSRLHPQGVLGFVKPMGA